MAETMSPLGTWLVQLFNDISFQADDELSAKTVNEGFGKNFKITINGQTFDGATFGSLIQKARSENTYVLKTKEELFVVAKNDREGHVANRASWTKTVKATGEQVGDKNVSIVTVGVEDGKLVLIDMVELAA